MPDGLQFIGIQVYPGGLREELVSTQTYRAADRRDLLILQHPAIIGTHLVPGPLTEAVVNGRPVAVYETEMRNSTVRHCILEREDSFVKIMAVGLSQKEVIEVVESLQ